MESSQNCQKRLTVQYLGLGDYEWDTFSGGWVSVDNYKVTEASLDIHLQYSDVFDDTPFTKDVKQGVVVSSLEISALRDEGVEIQMVLDDILDDMPF